VTNQQNSRDTAHEQNRIKLSDNEAHRDPGLCKERAARIRQLNDALRTDGRGGMVQMTNGIASLGLPKVNAIFSAIAAFSDFNADNDPWGEHDCASLTVDGVHVIWKIDYYDRRRAFHSPDPADPNLTVRVLTAMLAEEH
jgi:hypothetical protein